MQLGEFRQQYPQYNAWSDADLAEALYQKYYSDRDKGAFYSAIGVPLVDVEQQPEVQPEPEEDTGWLEGLYDSAGDVMAGIASSFATMPVSAVKGTGAVFGADVEGGFVSGLSETEQDIQRFFGGDPSTVPYKFGSALGSMGAFVATTVLGGLAAPVTGGASLAGIGVAGTTLLARLAPLAVKYGPAAAMGMGVGASEQADRLRALGDKLGDVDEIDRRIALAGGFAVGATEIMPLRFPVGLILSKLKKQTPKWLADQYVRSVLRAAKTGGLEGLQEAGAQVMQNAIAKGLYDPDLDLTESAAENFGYGAAAGTTLQAVLELALPRTRRKPPPEAPPPAEAPAAAPEAVAPVEEAPQVVAARTVLGGVDQAAAEAAEQAAVASVAPEKASNVLNIVAKARQDFVDFGGAGSRAHDDVQEAILQNFGQEEAAIYAAEVDRLVKQAVDARLSAEAAAVPPEPTQPTLPGFEDMRLEFASEEVIGEDVDGTEVATRIVSDFSEFLPIAFDKGAVPRDTTGEPAVYRVGEDEQGRFFVEAKNGVKASPYLSTREQAETVRGEMNSRVPEILKRIDEAETEVLAREAGAQARQSERGAVLSAARAISSPAALPTVDFGDLDDMTRARVNGRRLNTGREELTEKDSVSIVELSTIGLNEAAIADLLPDPVIEYTANDIIARVQERGYKTDDEGFRRWARRGAGGPDLKTMTGAQLQQLAVEAEKLPEVFPAVEGLLPLPVVRTPEVSAQQYAAVINMAKAMPARPDKNLAEGEIQKSDINKSLGVRAGLAEGIVEEGIRRGDLVRSKRNAFVVRDKAREADIAAAEEAAVEVDEFGQMELPIKIPLSELGSSPATRAAAAADFKTTIEQAIVDARIKRLFPKLGGREGVVKDLTARMSEVFKRKGADASKIAVSIVNTLEGKREGEFNADKLAIAVALDALPADVKSDMEARKLLREVVDHEVIHALRELGLFSAADWQILTNFVRKTQRIEKRTRTPGETFYVDAVKNYTDIFEKEGLSGKELEDAIVEEAVAEAFRDYGAGELNDRKIIINGKEQGFTGKPASLFKRIVDFFRKLRGSLDKMEIRNAYDVFSELRETQRYRRPAPTGPPTAAGPARERLSDLPLDELQPEAEAAAPRAPIPARAAVRRAAMTGRAYPIAPRDEWYGDANYEMTGGRMEMMSPDEFLAEAPPLEIDELSRENIDDLKFHIESGRTLDPLAFWASGKEDGRHRAVAAKELGIREVPVLRWPARAAEGAAARAPIPVRAAVRRLGADSASVQVAPDEVKGSTLGADEDAEWRRLRPSRTKAGKILGAPSWVKTSGDMVRLRKRLAQLVKEGESGRFWFEDSARSALEITGGNLADAERFIGLLAIYSPQTKVFVNTGYAIKAFTQWENGEPVNVRSDLDGKAQRWLDRGEDWGGRKTNSFYLNIMHDIANNASQEELAQLNLDPDLLQEVKKATVDLWVLRALGYDVDVAGSQDRGSGKYSFSEDEIRRMAGVLNGKLKDGERRWLPHQVQAALWSAIKGRAEIPSVKDKTNEQSVERGFATMGEDGRPQPPQSLGPARSGHMKIWLRNALQASPQDTARSIESARGSFRDMVERIAQNVTWEAVPSTKVDTAIYGASDIDQRDFTEEAVELLLDDGGIDLLAKQLGVSLGNLRRSTGAYEAKIGPNVITGLVPIKPAGSFDNSLAYAYARAIQYIFRQDAVPIFRADPTIKFDKSYKIISPKTGRVVRAVGTYGEAVDVLQGYIQREAQKEARAERTGKSYSPVQYFVRGDDAAQGIQFVFDAPLTKTREKQFFSALRRVYGRDVGYTKVSPDRIALINYRSGEMDGVPWDGGRVAENIPFLMPDDRFLSLSVEFDPQQGGAVAGNLGIKEVVKFGSIGEYGPVHDWAADPDGKVLLDERSETRRPDLQSWIRNRRKAAEELTARYDRAERSKRRGRREDPRADRPGRDVGLEEARVPTEQREAQPLPGLEPRAFGLNPEIEEAARIYAERAGIPYVRQAEYVPIDPEFSARIATAYEEMAHAPSDPAVQRAYRAMIDETLAQYQVIKEMGYTIEMMREGMDAPYSIPRMALEDLANNKHMWIYPTDFGYGSDASAALDPATNPLLEFTEEVDATGRPMRANDVFRAVHDFFGHGIEGAGFRGRGEENAWQSHSRLYSAEALPAVTAETRGQNSWVNYGPYGETNRTASQEDTVYADQKVGLMPSWTWTENVAEDMVERPTRRYSVRRPKRSFVDREMAAAPTKEEALRIRDALRSGTIRTGDYRERFADDALSPTYVAPTPLVWEGEVHSVVIQKGHNEWDDLKQGYNGFGIRHANEHLPDIQQNTQFDSVESFVEGMLNAYQTSRNTPEASNFDLRQSGSAVVLQWNNPDWGVPGKLVFKEQSYNRYKKAIAANPNLINKTFLGLTTAFALSTDRGALAPKIMVQINPASSNRAKRAAGEAKPNERVNRKLRKKYSVKRGLDENYTPEEKKLHEQHFDTGQEETFFEKIMRGLGLNSNDSSSFFNKRDKFRMAAVDVNHPWLKPRKVYAKQLAKEGLVDEIMADSSTGAMMALLTRASGVVAAALTKAPIIYSRGMFVSTDPKALDHWHDDIAQARLEEIWEMIRRSAYIDPITGEDVSWESPENVKGLVGILQGMDNAGLLPQFFAYAGAMRAKRLIKENREKLFTEDTIAAFEKLAERFPEIKRAHQEYQLWNNTLVNLMTDTGVISEQMGELWKENADYLPFYREFYADEGVEYQVLSVKGDPLRDTLFERLENRDNNKFFPSSYNVKQPKELKGGKPVYRVMVNNVADTTGSYTDRKGQAILKRADELAELNPNAIITIIAGSQRIQDPLSNILMNASAAITSSMTNVAVSRGIRDLRLLGDTMARPVSDEEAPTTPHANKIGIRVRGETKWYWVGDRMLVDSLAVTNDVSMSSLGLQALPAQLLRELVTKDPGFMAANMLRDTLTSWTTSGVDVMPVVGTLRGYGEALMGTVSARALEGMGVYGGYDFKGDPQNVKKSFEAHIKRGRKVRMRDAPGRIWYGWDKIAGASDLSTRIAVYNSVLEATGNEAQAALEALEVINFSRKGASPVIRYLTAVVPFMNARIQGLDVLYRGSKGEISDWGKQARRKNFYFRAATIVALTAAYHLYHSQSDEEDDPWYHNAPEYIKDNYWIIPPTWVGMSKNSPAIRIPIPFEVGVLFKVIPERIMSLIDGSSDGRETWNSLGRHTFSTLNFNPTPQWALPVLEGVMNHSFYRGERILSYWDEKNEGWLADPEYASPFAIMLSEAVDKQGGRISAQKIDHVFRGYVGTLGSYALMAADSAGRIAAGIPERPTRRLDQWPVIGRFLQENEGRGPIQTFYDLYEELDIFNTTLNNLKRREDFRGEDYYRTSRANLEMHAEQIKILKAQLDGLRTFKRQIQWDRQASPASKRRALDGVAKLSNEILSGIKDLRTKALVRR